jgi:hypothetical protein
VIHILYPDAAGIMQSIALLELEPTHDFDTTPTDHPLEEGSDVTDGLRLELEQFSARCFVSNAMHEAAETQMGNAVATMQSVEGPNGSLSVYGLSEPVDRVQLVFDALLQLRETRRPCTIVTNRRRYESMAIRRMSFPETNLGSMEFTLEARQVRIVSTQTQAAPRPRQVRGHPPANGGTTTTSTPAVTPPPAAPTRSAAQAFLRSVVGDD